MESNRLSDSSEEWFGGLTSEDGWGISEVIKVVREVAGWKSLRPVELRGLARLLLGLQRLPLATPGLDVEVYASHRDESGAYGYTLRLDEMSFQAGSGGYVTGPYGADSVSGERFESETGGFRFADSGFSWAEWLDGFRMYLDEETGLKLSDGSDGGALDWELDDGAAYWQYLPDLR